MARSVINIAYVLLMVITLEIAYCVRVSPKLDFGSDNNAQDAKIRPTFQSRSFNYGDRELNKVQGIDVSCPSGNCNVSDKQNGVVTDVVVQVKTKTEVDAKNSTNEISPDIPIIVGTKGNEFPTISLPNAFSDFPPPFPINTLIQNRMQQTDLRKTAGSDYNYALGYQGNGANLYPVYNEHNSNGNNLPLPQFTWNNPKRQNAGVNYNPVEFKKLYHNSWAGLPIKPLESRFSSVGRDYPSPCVCENQQPPYIQAPALPRF